jgi:iron complex outermembrane receptor protein
MKIELRRQMLRSPLLVISVIALLGGPLAQAQQQGRIEEIVVTAQKRVENIQDVPIAISAYTAETLQKKGLNDITRLSALTPNVNLDGGSPFSGDSSVLSASIRGIGQDDFAFNLDPGVGVYLDGVFLARTIGANQGLLDVDRIEIAKGPQGTLFGRNTIGGAINIVTHVPGDEFKVAGSATLGAYNRQDINLMVDMPITQNILSTVSLSSQSRQGWQDVVPYPADSSIGQNPYTVMGQADMPRAPGTRTSSHNGGKDVQAMRGKILIHATDNLDITVTGDYTHQDQSGLANTVLGVFTLNQDHYIDPNGAGAGELFAGPSIQSAIFGNFYNMCVSSPASALATGLGGGTNTTNGACGPLGVGTWNSTTGKFRGNGFTSGVPALGGAGAVGVPNAVLQDIISTYGGTLQPDGSYLLTTGDNGVVTLGKDRFGGSVIYPGQTPRLYWDFQNTQAPSKDKTFSNGSSFARYNAYGTSITLDWDIRDNMKLKSITGWRGIKWDIGTDLDGTPESLQEVTDEQKQWQVSQEFQLTGRAFDDRLDYVAGLYYFTEQGYVHDFVPFDTAYLWIYDFRNNVHTDSYAAYTHLDFRVTSKLGLTFGARYSVERKKFEGGQADLNGADYKFSGCLDPAADANTFPAFAAVPAGVSCQAVLGYPDPNNPLRYFPVGFDHQSWNVFTPMGGIQYHFTDDLMAYFTYSEGFKSGGWTTRLSTPTLSASTARFDPEYDKTYEVGLKSQWFDNRVRANIAGFYSQYDGIQINVQEGPSPVYQNAGDAEIKGVELEMQSVFDNGFSLGLAAGYMDAKYVRLEPCLLYIGCDPANGSAYDTVFGGFIKGQTELPKTPEYKVTISPSYEFNLLNGSTVLLLADYTLTGHMQNTAPNVPLLRRPSTDMLNMSAHWTSGSGQYEFVAGVTNLTDNRYLTVGSVNAAAGEIVGSYSAPRMWYVSVRAHFQ